MNSSAVSPEFDDMYLQFRQTYWTAILTTRPGSVYLGPEIFKTCFKPSLSTASIVLHVFFNVITGSLCNVLPSVVFLFVIFVE